MGQARDTATAGKSDGLTESRAELESNLQTVRSHRFSSRSTRLIRETSSFDKCDYTPRGSELAILQPSIDKGVARVHRYTCTIITLIILTMNRLADAAPLKPDEFCVLLVLLHGDRHGYAIMQEAAERSNGRVELRAGVLYRLLARLLREGLVAESQRRPAPDADDERRRYYRITPLGRRTIAADAERMAALAAAARAALAVGARA